MHSGPHPRRELTPVVFEPTRALGAIVGAGFASWALVLAALLGAIAWGGEPGIKTFLAWAAAGVLGILGAFFLSWTYALASLAYVIEDDYLIIRWGFRSILIPIEDIQRLAPGRTFEEIRVRGLNWWGCHVGTAEVERLGKVRVYSTHNASSDLVYVVTPQGAYALSVPDHSRFAEEIQLRAIPGPVEARAQRAVITGVAALPVWRDRLALVTLGVAGAFCAVLAAVAFASYPGLPDVVQLDFPSTSGLVRIGDKGELLRIPALGAGILGANAVLGFAMHSRERAAGVWLFGAAAILQLVLVGAAVSAFAAA